MTPYAQGSSVSKMLSLLVNRGMTCSCVTGEFVSLAWSG